MYKRFLAAIFAVLMIFAIGCDNDVVYDNLSEYESETPVVEQEEKPTLFVNPLTGVAEFEDEAKTKQRPIAIMVNNVNIAQSKQTGLSKADIVYETEVEGGITRLMAVYQDVSDVDKIGTVRSARYPYVDLALGHNAVYIHCGQDPTYCAPHLKDIDHISIDSDVKGAKRISNGLATEHTLYAIAGDLAQTISGKFDMKVTSSPSWAKFTDTAITLGGGSATSVSVPFPAIKSNFTYDAQSGLYTRLLGSNVQTDYFTQETTQVKNIFILLTNISTYPDGAHRKVELQSGKGYYITNGTMQEINWSKGAATNGFTFTDANGEEIQINSGNSWVCIANKNTCKPVIE